MSVLPTSIEDVQHVVREHATLHICGARTKTALHLATSATALGMGALRGVMAYDPQEFVLTAYAGTPVNDIVALLNTHGQYLPFDPLLVHKGATLGGTVAANASGAGRFRFGGVRDFLLGTRQVDGNGGIIRGGGNVVKNAAGFDYPKLMVGSRGNLGVLVELTFKVFPKPEKFATLLVQKPNFEDTLNLMLTLSKLPLDMEALDFFPQDLGGWLLAVRVGGIASGLPTRMTRLQQITGTGEVLLDEADVAAWRNANEFEWAGNAPINKMPVTPEGIRLLEKQLSNTSIARRYSVGGNVAYIAAPYAHSAFQSLMLLGKPSIPSAENKPHAFAQRIKQALDPQNKFI